MPIVERANVVLQVTENEVEKYLNKGFNLVDEAGHILKECMPNDIGTLRKAYSDHIAQIKALESENASLKAQLAETKNKRSKNATND